jgi:hypothetical protein
MIAPTQIKKPSNWQDFEKLCKLLWGEIWNCEDSIKRNGRQGQNQHGVDVYAYSDKYEGYCGIQCKGKDDYTNSQLTEKEIDEEIEKAMSFEPSLKLLIFATTANKEAKTEAHIRKKDVENKQKGLFKVDIASWEDIVDHLERYRTTYNWYVNNCQFIDATDVSVTFDGKEEVFIYPEYVKTTIHYEYKELNQIERALREQIERLDFTKNPMSIPQWYRSRRVDKRWCRLHIHIENVGSTVIKSPKLKVFFRPKDVEVISDRFMYCNDFLIDSATKAQINASKDANREVFQTDIYEIEYRPKESIFVQKDSRVFSISIIATDSITQLQMGWCFLCENYQKKGHLTINVKPVIEENTETIVVYNEEDMKPDRVKFAPKIVED